MFEITQDALKELEAYFEGKEKSPIRIYFASGGCSGPRLALALDEPQDADQTFTEGGFTFCIEKDLLTTLESVRVSVSYMGFQVDPGKPLPAGAAAGGCAGCGGGCATA